MCVAPTFVCIHFVVHYWHWQSLVLLSSFSGQTPPHQWCSETFFITLLSNVWSRHVGQKNLLLKNDDCNYFNVFALFDKNNDNGIQSTQLLISNISLFIYIYQIMMEIFVMLQSVLSDIRRWRVWRSRE